MLLQFNFKNYKSFKDDTTLDMTATRMSDYSSHVVELGGERVLTVASVFGANAGGKSNVVDAFRYMSVYVLNSLDYASESGKRKKSEFISPTPFLFESKSREAESLFEVYFIDSDDSSQRTYNYGFTVNAFGICEEWLSYKPKTSKDEYKTVFYRNTETSELDLSGLPAKSRDNLRVALERETLLVSLGARIKVDKLKLVRDWFYKNDIVDFGEPMETAFRSRQIPPGFAEDESVRKNVVRYFSSFDSSIVDFYVEPIKRDDGSESFSIDAVHKMIDSDETAVIPLQSESAGTLKMFTLYPILTDILEFGGVLFIDELNARLHPLLVRTFVQIFLNCELNPKHAQLIFTSHDSWQLNSNLLRRDEIWFVDKDERGVSRLYSLADFVDEGGAKIRRDENYEKNYLLGKYGAIPSVSSFDMLVGE